MGRQLYSNQPNPRAPRVQSTRQTRRNSASPRINGKKWPTGCCLPACLVERLCFGKVPRLSTLVSGAKVLQLSLSLSCKSWGSKLARIHTFYSLHNCEKKTGVPDHRWRCRVSVNRFDKNPAWENPRWRWRSAVTIGLTKRGEWLCKVLFCFVFTLLRFSTLD